MANQVIDLKQRKLPDWYVGEGGKKKHLGGRWNMDRVAEELIKGRHRIFTMDDLARLVYGSTSKTNREKARKHIPAQRNHMLARLMPFVTTYGPRGTIDAIKCYESDEPEDVRKLALELERLRSRSEISEDRYQQLREILSLPSPESIAASVA
jgi:hypothetical protein